MRICFTIGRKRYCIDIPVLYDPWWRFRKPPPWLTLDEKAVDIAQDLRVLASIFDLASDLSPKFRRALQPALQQAAASIQEKLPAGAELHFAQQTAK